MKRLKKVNTNSRNGRISALLTLLLKVFEEDDWSADDYLTPILSELKALNAKLIEALHRVRIHSQLAKKDAERDKVLRALFKSVEGYTYNPITRIQTAAKEVEGVLKPYGLSIQYENYAGESAHIKSLLNDLNQSEPKTALTQLQGIELLITMLAKAQQSFENLAVEQAEKNFQRKELPTATQLKKEALLLLNTKLIDYLNTMAEVKPQTYEGVARTLKELIIRNNAHIKHSKTNEVL